MFCPVKIQEFIPKCSLNFANKNYVLLHGRRIHSMGFTHGAHRGHSTQTSRHRAELGYTSVHSKGKMPLLLTSEAQ